MATSVHSEGIDFQGSIVTVRNAEEQALLEALNPDVDFWLGGSDCPTENLWRWADDQKVFFAGGSVWGVYENFHVSEPGYNTKDSPFAMILRKTDPSFYGWKWADSSLVKTAAVVCEYCVDVKSRATTPTAATSYIGDVYMTVEAEALHYPRGAQDYDCRTGVKQYRWFTAKKNWWDAQLACAKSQMPGTALGGSATPRRGSLASVRSLEEQSMIYSLGITDAEVWVGGNDAEQEARWVWVSDETLLYWPLWNSNGEPVSTDGYDYTVMRLNTTDRELNPYEGYLFAAPYDSENSYVCEYCREHRDASPPAPPPEAPSHAARYEFTNGSFLSAFGGLEARPGSGVGTTEGCGGGCMKGAVTFSDSRDSFLHLPLEFMLSGAKEFTFTMWIKFEENMTNEQTLISMHHRDNDQVPEFLVSVQLSSETGKIEAGSTMIAGGTSYPFETDSNYSRGILADTWSFLAIERQADGTVQIVLKSASYCIDTSVNVDKCTLGKYITPSTYSLPALGYTDGLIFGNGLLDGNFTEVTDGSPWNGTGFIGTLDDFRYFPRVLTKTEHDDTEDTSCNQEMDCGSCFGDAHCLQYNQPREWFMNDCQVWKCNWLETKAGTTSEADAGDCVVGNAPPSLMCREATLPCDEVDFCDGESGTCGDDEVRKDTAVCRQSAGECDAIDYCDGTEKTCADGFAENGTVCRPKRFDQDIAETCNGTWGLCPPDETAPEVIPEVSVSLWWDFTGGSLYNGHNTSTLSDKTAPLVKGSNVTEVEGCRDKFNYWHTHERCDFGALEFHQSADSYLEMSLKGHIEGKTKFSFTMWMQFASGRVSNISDPKTLQKFIALISDVGDELRYGVGSDDPNGLLLAEDSELSEGPSGTERIRPMLDNEDYTGGLARDVWIHLAIVYDSSDYVWRIYRDADDPVNGGLYGAWQGLSSWGGFPDPGGSGSFPLFLFGNDADGQKQNMNAKEAFAGRLDKLKFFSNVALTEAQVARDNREGCEAPMLEFRIADREVNWTLGIQNDNVTGLLQARHTPTDDWHFVASTPFYIDESVAEGSLNETKRAGKICEALGLGTSLASFASSSDYRGAFTYDSADLAPYMLFSHDDCPNATSAQCCPFAVSDTYTGPAIINCTQDPPADDESCFHDGDCVWKERLYNMKICQAWRCSYNPETDGSTPGECYVGARSKNDVCRNSTGTCDLPEYCDGGVYCPADDVKNTSFVCRGLAGPCDAVEYCDGYTKVCPDDEVATTSFECRAVNDSMWEAGDVAEYCDGKSVLCPADFGAPDPTVEPITDWEYRLADVNFSTGRFELRPSPIHPWGTICATMASEFDDDAAQLACKSLGMPSYAAKAILMFGGGTGPQYFNGTTCPGLGSTSSAFKELQLVEMEHNFGSPLGWAWIEGTIVGVNSDGTYNVAAANDNNSDGNYTDGEVWSDIDDDFIRVRPWISPEWQYYSVGDEVEYLLDVSGASEDVSIAWQEGFKITAIKAVGDNLTEFPLLHYMNVTFDISDDSPLGAVTNVTAEQVRPKPTDFQAPFALACTDIRNTTACEMGHRFDVGIDCTPPDATPAPPKPDITVNGSCWTWRDCEDVVFEDDAGEALNLSVCEMPVCNWVAHVHGHNSPGNCVIGPAHQGTMCREPAGVCDWEEVCDGLSSTCPSDKLKPDIDECRRIAGDCDVAEFCDGAEVDCPEDSKAEDTVVCRNATGDCDLAETCDGENDSCPADALADNNTVCRESTDDCDPTDYCTGNSWHCPNDTVAPEGTLCRDYADSCDKQEFCDGSDAACPTDEVFTADCSCTYTSDCTGKVNPDYFGGCERVADAGSGICVGDCEKEITPFDDDEESPDYHIHTCRSVTAGPDGDCDIKEVCDGVDSECPEDEFEPAGTYCRFEKGDCDVGEFCDGRSAACPDDELIPADTLCRRIAGPCDTPEFCDGNTTRCPRDEFLPSTTLCRPTAPGMLCDAPEYCTGDMYRCPGDITWPKGTDCYVDGENETSQCNGVNKECQTWVAQELLTAPPQDTALALPSDAPGALFPTYRGYMTRCGRNASVARCFVCGDPNEFVGKIEVAPGGTGLSMGFLNVADPTDMDCDVEYCMPDAVVALPYPSCLTECSLAMCPDLQDRMQTSYLTTQAGTDMFGTPKNLWTCTARNITTEGVEGTGEVTNACPPWPYAAPQPQLLAAVGGGDPRYSSRGGVMVQCDTPGPNLFATNVNYSVTVVHTPIPPHMATYISSLRVDFLGSLGMSPLVFEASEVGSWPGVDRSNEYLTIAAPATGEGKVQIESAALGFSLYLESIEVAGAYFMINMAFKGKNLAAGIVARGCEDGGSAVKVEIPESEACADVAPALREGCNYDVFAVGTAEAAKVSRAFAEVTTFVQYNPAVAVTVKAVQVEAEQVGDREGGAGKHADDDDDDDRNDDSNTALLIGVVVAAVVCLLLIAAVVVVLVLRRVRGSNDEKNSDKGGKKPSKSMEQRNGKSKEKKSSKKGAERKFSDVEVEVEDVMVDAGVEKQGGPVRKNVLGDAPLSPAHNTRKQKRRQKKTIHAPNETSLSLNSNSEPNLAFVPAPTLCE